MAKKVKEKKKVPKEKPKLASQIVQARVSGSLTLDFDFEIPCRNYNEAEQLVQKGARYSLCRSSPPPTSVVRGET